MDKKKYTILSEYLDSIYDRTVLFFQNGIINIGFEEKEILKKFDEEVVKYKSQWLDHIDAINILREQIRQFALEHGMATTNSEVFIRDLFSKDSLTRLSKQILSFIETIPRKYLILISLPPMGDLPNEEIEIADNLSILQIKKKSKFEGLIKLFKNSKNLSNYFLPGGLFFRLDQQGYINDLRESVTIENSISLLRQFIHLGQIIDIFSKKGLIEALIQSKYFPLIFAFDNETSPIHIRNFTLDHNLTNYLSRLKIDEKKQIFKDSDSDKRRLLNKVFNPNEKYAETILAASEWALNSELNENKTFSFIQVCIGLEAMLGIGLGENLTKMLSDRCSYLLGRNFREREKIRKKFEELYKIRSNLVHGRKSQLDLDENEYLDWGKRTLDQIILKELVSM